MSAFQFCQSLLTQINLAHIQKCIQHFKLVTLMYKFKDNVSFKVLRHNEGHERNKAQYIVILNN